MKGEWLIAIMAGGLGMGAYALGEDLGRHEAVELLRTQDHTEPCEYIATIQGPKLATNKLDRLAFELGADSKTMVFENGKVVRFDAFNCKRSTKS